MASFDDEIIEKRASSPIATSCLVLSFFALLGAIFLQLVEIGEIRSALSSAARQLENPAEDIFDDDMRAFKASVASLLADVTKGDDDLPHKDAEPENLDADAGAGSDGEAEKADGASSEG